MSDLLFKVEDEVARITLNREDSLNAFSEEMIEEWIVALEKIRDTESIRVVVITGAGKAFCAGGDIKEMGKGKGFYKSKEDISSTGMARKNSLWKKVQRIPLLLEEIDKPVIAKVNGIAFGAGLDMALMCDIRIIAEEAKLSESYINVGLVPGDGGAYFLPRIVGIDKALDLLWTGKILNGKQAEEYGIATFSVPTEELDNFTDNYIAKLVEAPQHSINLIKRIVYQSQDMSLQSSLDMVSSHMGLVTELEDYKQKVKKLLK